MNGNPFPRRLCPPVALLEGFSFLSPQSYPKKIGAIDELGKSARTSQHLVVDLVVTTIDIGVRCGASFTGSSMAAVPCLACCAFRWRCGKLVIPTAGSNGAVPKGTAA